MKTKFTFLLFFLCLTAMLSAQDPVLYLDFEGDANDNSGNQLNGVVSGTVTFVDDTDRGGKVARFGEDGHITLPVDAKLMFGADKDFTFSVWINTTTTINSDPAIISSQDWNSGGNPGFGIYLQDDDDKGGGVMEFWKFKSGNGDGGNGIDLDFDGHDIITNGWGEGFDNVM